MKRRLQGDLIAAFLCLKEMYKKEENILFSRACCYRARGSGFHLKEGSFRVDVRKMFCVMKVVKRWNRFIDAPFLKIFKVRLNRVLSDLS